MGEKKYVMLWVDSFSETLDTRGAQAMVAVLQRAGYTVLIPPADACCGLTWIPPANLATPEGTHASTRPARALCSVGHPHRRRRALLHGCLA
ncbi:hypothetical protein [Trueperella pyogenes]|uniref:hypothetical protein n=1 Tax=Trueperella pyogenes TaxID=1661 RepID=UPI003519E045